MTKIDLMFFTGLGLILVGLGGGYELMVLAYSRAFLATAAAQGAGDPTTLARDVGHAFQWLALGTPVALLGLVLVLLAFRDYLVRGPTIGRTDRVA